MRQDLIKCILHDEKRKLPQIDEYSQEESHRPRKKKISFKSIDEVKLELDNEFEHFLGEVFVRNRLRMRSLDDRAMRKFLPLEILDDEEEESLDNQLIPDVQQNNDNAFEVDQIIEEEKKDEENDSLHDDPSIEEEL